MYIQTLVVNGSRLLTFKMYIKMKQYLAPFLVALVAVVVGLVVYNMFIAGSSWFGHYEGSANYETDGNGNVIDMNTGERIAV